MRKKGVPDWFTSSLWSSSSSSSNSISSSFRTRSGSGSSPTTPKPETRNGSETQIAPIPGGDLTPLDGSEEEISCQSLLFALVSKKVINLGELRRLALQGIPDGAGIRSIVWKLLLGYLPNDHALWEEELDRKRSQYNAFKDEFLLNPSEITRRQDESADVKREALDLEDKGFLPRADISHGEHPLSLGKKSVWNQFFQMKDMGEATYVLGVKIQRDRSKRLLLQETYIKQVLDCLHMLDYKSIDTLLQKDTEVIEQIDRDVMRTHPDMHFFSGDSSLAKSNQDSLKHILIIFAKLNPGIRYVQGMNEVLAPLYYVFRNDPDEKNAVCAEADAFFCFVELLSGFRDNFCQKLDNSDVGIRCTISKLSNLLKKHDLDLWRHLEFTTKVNPHFYAFRWITLLLTQEFNFADIIHIWDTLLSDPEGPQETLLRICCAMLILVRRRLLAGDFTSNLKLLQHYPSKNISHLLYVANKLRGSSSSG